MSTAALPFIPRYRRWPAVLGSMGALLLVLIVTCEVIGWPFLAGPMQQWLSDSLHRRVSFAVDGNVPASVVVRLLGRVRVEAPLIDIGPPAWSKAAHLLHASDVVISFRYVDLWRAYLGGPLRIHKLEADELDADIEGLPDGRSSWTFGRLPAASDQNAHPFQVPPLFDELKVHSGVLRWRDAMSDVHMAIECKVLELAEDPGAILGATRASPDVNDAAGGLACHARGTWRNEPVSVSFRSVAAMPWINRDSTAERTPMRVDATVGETRLVLRGSAIDVLGLTGLNAHFETEGTTIATLAKTLDLQLDARAPFRATGRLTQEGRQWRITLDRLHLGTSTLNGSFMLDHARAVPLLSGRLEGSRLTWADITSSPPPASVAAKQSVDMPAFRTLDADISVDVAQVDLGAAESLAPLRGTWRASKGRIVWAPTATGKQ